VTEEENGGVGRKTLIHYSLVISGPTLCFFLIDVSLPRKLMMIVEVRMRSEKRVLRAEKADMPRARLT
jgi:hypothetical protein